MSALERVGADKRTPAFLTKTFHLVSHPSTNALMKWADSGLTFSILRPLELAQHVLPKYFKHNNIASFIRQLNMYGFHKVGAPENMEFYNEHFRRDCPGELHLIQRKRSATSMTTTVAPDKKIAEVTEEMQSFKRKRDELFTDVGALQRSVVVLEDQVDSLQGVCARLDHELRTTQQAQSILQQNLQTVLTVLVTVFPDFATLGNGDGHSAPPQQSHVHDPSPHAHRQPQHSAPASHHEQPPPSSAQMHAQQAQATAYHQHHNHHQQADMRPAKRVRRTPPEGSSGGVHPTPPLVASSAPVMSDGGMPAMEQDWAAFIPQALGDMAHVERDGDLPPSEPVSAPTAEEMESWMTTLLQ